MARWKLTAPHYLNVPGTEWEYEETSRESGKRKREKVPVPLLVELNDREFMNNDGDVIVCHGDKLARTDIIFIGNPTPDMEPLDDEAEAITADLRPRWEHPIDTLPANGGMTSHEMAFMENMMKAFASQNVAPAPNTGVSPEAFAALQKLVEDQAVLIAQLTKPGTEPTGRRV